VSAIDEAVEAVRTVLKAKGVGGGLTVAQREALRFYADPANWKPGGTAFEPTPAPVAVDRGDLARMALGEDRPAGKKKGGEKASKKSARRPVKDELEDEPEDAGADPRPTERPPAVFVDVVCKGCGKTEKVPEVLAKTKLNDAGDLVVDYACGRCIRDRRVR
jgi:hypothetical protein